MVRRGGGCDAFERPSVFRQRQWAKIPENLDVLITHNPPVEPQGVSRGRGDEWLTMRLAEMAAPPRVHVFGHDHKANGRIQTPSTLFINAEQEGSLKWWGERGRPHIFDLDARSEYTGPGLEAPKVCQEMTPRRQQTAQRLTTRTSAKALATFKVDRAAVGVAAAPGASSQCSTPGCSQVPWNGQPQQPCCRSCQQGNGSSHGPNCKRKFKDVAARDAAERRGTGPDTEHAITLSMAEAMDLDLAIALSLVESSD